VKVISSSISVAARKSSREKDSADDVEKTTIEKVISSSISVAAPKRKVKAKISTSCLENWLLRTPKILKTVESEPMTMEKTHAAKETKETSRVCSGVVISCLHQHRKNRNQFAPLVSGRGKTAASVFKDYIEKGKPAVVLCDGCRELKKGGKLTLKSLRGCPKCKFQWLDAYENVKYPFKYHHGEYVGHPGLVLRGRKVLKLL